MDGVSLALMLAVCDCWGGGSDGWRIGWFWIEKAGAEG